MAKKANPTLTKITTLAKKIYAEGKTKKWTDAIKKASKQLKDSGAI